MLMHLKRAGKLDKIEGVVIGGFTDMKDTERPYGKSIFELINDQIQPLEVPYCFGFPVSHGKENYALKIGVKCELNIHQDVVTLKELTG
jgi:muramoyltetrapeptide carboxypeptidase